MEKQRGTRGGRTGEERKTEQRRGGEREGGHSRRGAVKECAHVGRERVSVVGEVLVVRLHGDLLPPDDGQVAVAGVRADGGTGKQQVNNG